MRKALYVVIVRKLSIPCLPSLLLVPEGNQHKIKSYTGHEVSVVIDVHLQALLEGGVKRIGQKRPKGHWYSAD